jgi:ketosteroid isomerase-like protein
VTDDFALIPPNDPGARGTDGIRTWFAGTFGAFSIAELEFPTTELHIGRDLAVRHYTYDWTLTPDAGGEPIRDLGDGLYVYERQTDGSWLISYDLWTSSEPLPVSR